MFVKTTNGTVDTYPYNVGQLRRDNPKTSFPKQVPDEMLAEWNVFPVTITNRPTVDHTKNVTEGTPVLINGTWTQVWETTDATAEEIAERTDQQANSVRSQRDNLVSQSDWRVIKAQETGTAMSAEWVAYRQALRDITDHANFPWLDDADWTVKAE